MDCGRTRRCTGHQVGSVSLRSCSATALSTRPVCMRYFTAAAAVAAGAYEATDPLSPPSAPKTAAAVNVARPEVEALKTLSNHGDCRRRAYASSVAPAATSSARPGDSSNAAANVAVSSTVIFIFCVRWIGRSCAIVASTRSAAASGSVSTDEPGTYAKANAKPVASTQATYAFKAGRISATSYFTA